MSCRICGHEPCQPNCPPNRRDAFGIDSGVALREQRPPGVPSAAGKVQEAIEVASMTKPKPYTRDEMYEAASCCYNAGDATVLCDMVEQLLDDSDKIARVLAILPGMEENTATKGVARKLRGILE